MLKIIPGLPHWPACFFCMSVCWGSISWVSVAGVKTTRGFYVLGWLKSSLCFVCVACSTLATVELRDTLRLSPLCFLLQWPNGICHKFAFLSVRESLKWDECFSSLLSLENTPHSFPSSPLDSLHWIGSVNLSHFKGFLSTCQFSN